jgi:hypothetical protein
MEQWLGPDAEGSLDELIEHLAGDGRCPLCGGAFTRDARICVVRGRRLILSVQCYCCGTGSLISAPAPQHSGLYQPPHTELTPAESLHFAHTDPLSSDDVLDMHNFLRHFRGDLAGLGCGLQQPPAG